MQCPKCQFENREGANFCDNCGRRLQSNIEILEKGSKSDSHSFTPSDTKPTSHATTIVGERKYVTVLFSDLTGYTAMSEKIDPEEVKDITTLIFGKIAKVIAKYDGFVEKYIGDAVMAIFGAKKTREDDPIRAIKAAMEIHEIVQTQSTCHEYKIDHPLSMHSGVNTGLVVTGEINLEKGIHGIAGDTINLAARLSGLGNVDDILVGPDTFLLAKGYFNFDALEPTKLRGKAEPVRIYRVLSIKRQPMAAKGIEGIETKTIGRDMELVSLQNAYHETMETKSTNVISIVGDAGIGKSRLLYEFQKWLATRPDDLQLFRGRGTPDNQRSTNGLWKNLFTFRFGIEVNDGTDQVLDKIRRNMADVLTQDQADLVGHFVGFDLSTSRAVKNLLGSASFEAMAFAYLTNYLRSITESQTVILLDDIHFADDFSIEILERIAKSIPLAPMLIVCMARPILYEQRSQWGEGIDRHQRVDLKPLSKRFSGMLVQEILKKASKIPDKLGTLVIDTAEGNPFYIEELIKMLIEDGVIVRGEEPWHIDPDKLSDLKIPTTLTGVLQARLDALPAIEKRLLQRASVIGRLFWDQAATQLVADDSDRLNSQELHFLLEDAKGRELIFERKPSNITESREFVFKHALLRDVAYETVLIKRRRIYHRQTAQWFTEKAGPRTDEYLHLIGSHYELAGENHKAIEYLSKAGEVFHSKNAYREAISVFEQVLNLLPEEAKQERVEVIVKLGQINNDKGDFSQAMAHFTQALADSEHFLSPGSLVATLYGMGFAYSKIGEYAIGIDYAKRGLAIARDHDDIPGAAQSFLILGWIYYITNQFGEARQYAQEALDISREIGDKKSISLSLNIMAACPIKGDSDESKKLTEECIAIGREIGDRLVIGRGLCNLGEVFRKQHNYPKAVRCYREALDISREIDQKNLICITLHNLGFALNQLESFNTAKQCFRESNSLALDIGSHHLALPSVAGMAEVYAYNNQLVESAKLIGMVCAHPMFTHEDAYETDRILALLRKDMLESELQSALDRGQKLDADEVFQRLLSDETKQ